MCTTWGSNPRWNGGSNNNGCAGTKDPIGFRHERSRAVSVSAASIHHGGPPFLTITTREYCGRSCQFKGNQSVLNLRLNPPASLAVQTDGLNPSLSTSRSEMMLNT